MATVQINRILQRINPYSYGRKGQHRIREVQKPFLQSFAFGILCLVG